MIPEIIEDPWFQINYMPACGCEHDEKKNLDYVSMALDASEVNIKLQKMKMMRKSVKDSVKLRDFCITGQ